MPISIKQDERNGTLLGERNNKDLSFFWGGEQGGGLRERFWEWPYLSLFLPYQWLDQAWWMTRWRGGGHIQARTMWWTQETVVCEPLKGCVGWRGRNGWKQWMNQEWASECSGGFCVSMWVSVCRGSLVIIKKCKQKKGSSWSKRHREGLLMEYSPNEYVCSSVQSLKGRSFRVIKSFKRVDSI